MVIKIMSTWWINKPYLLGNSNPTTEDLEDFWRYGFSVIVSLLAEQLQPPKYDLKRTESLGFTRHNIPVHDFTAPTIAQMETFAKLIDGLPDETKVIVHCEGGTGRTGTFAAAYWIAKGLSASEAIVQVRKVRPHAIETQEQEAALRDFADRCRYLEESEDYL